MNVRESSAISCLRNVARLSPTARQQGGKERKTEGVNGNLIPPADTECAQCRCFYGSSRHIRPSHMAAYHELQSIHVGNALDQATCGWHLCMSSTPSLARGS